MLKPKYKLSRAWFLHLAWQGGRDSPLCFPVSCATVRSYERINFSLLKDNLQLAIDTAVVIITCKAIRRFGKTLASPYLIMNVKRSSGRDNFKLHHDLKLVFCNLESLRLNACHQHLNCAQLLNTVRTVTKPWACNRKTNLDGKSQL